LETIAKSFPGFFCEKISDVIIHGEIEDLPTVLG